MDDVELGALMVKRKRLSDKVSALYADLRTRGKLLALFGAHLQNVPTQIVFLNTPGTIQVRASMPQRPAEYDWEELSSATDLESIVLQIKDYVDTTKQLEDVEQATQKRRLRRTKWQSIQKQKSIFSMYIRNV